MKKIDENHYETEDGKVVDRIRTIIFNIPECLQDEVAILVHERGYSNTEVGKEGIRSLSDIEGLWRRRRDFAIGRNLTPEEAAATAGSS